MQPKTAPWNILLIMVIALLITRPLNLISGGTNVWTSHGPEGGIIYALAIDPQTLATLYAGTYGGVFKSTNDGGLWSAANTGLANTYVNALAIDPATPTTLFAGTDAGGVFAIQQVPFQVVYLPLIVKQ